jgi:transposase
MKRQQVPPTDDWQQLRLLAKTPEQRTYELIRPVVLFGQPASIRARETGVPQRTLYRQADAFHQRGMASLAPPPKVERHQQLPAPIRQAIIELKREYPALNTHEITTICWARFGQRPSPRTVKRLLAEATPGPPAARRFPPYHAFADPVAARLAIIRLHIEGWLRFVSSKPAGAPPGDEEPGKEAYRTWTTGRSMWDAISHRCGEQRNASPPR